MPSRLLALALLALLALARAESPYFHAAQCVARGTACEPYFASRSGGACAPASAPSTACVLAGCKWCLFDAGKAASAPCTSDALRSRCGPMPGVATTAAPALGGNPHFFSAKCVSLRDGCTPFHAARSTQCVAGATVDNQPTPCIVSACTWCGWKSKQDSELCQSAAVQQACSGAAPSNPSVPDGPRSPVVPSPSPSQSPVAAPDATDATATPSPSPASPADVGGRQPEREAGSCTWTGTDSVVINLGEVTPATGWERTNRDGFSGLIFRPDWLHGLSPPSKGGAMCFPVQVQESGDYFWTFVSYAPHKTEHNDAWVMSREHGLRLWKTEGDRSLEEPAGKYLKAYQGNGAERGMSSEMKTVDHDGHRFTVLGVKAGEAFHVCMAGRSFKFSVFRLVLKKCFGTICEGGSLWREFVYDMPVSQCVDNA